MNQQPKRDRDTQDLIEQLRAKQTRGRRMRLAMVIVASFVVVVALAAAVSAAGGVIPGGNGYGSISNGDEGRPTTQSAAAAATSQARATTAPGPVTTTTGRSSTTTGHPVTATTKSSPTTISATATTTAQATATTKPASTPSGSASTKVVVIDPGHQAHADNALEPIGPGSTEKKAKVSSGTAGVVTGIPESELVLDVGLRLRDALRAHGIKVVMTRTSQNVDLSNIARAKIANEAKADLFIRIHADGAENSSTSGIHVLYPASIRGWTDDIAPASEKAAALAQQALIAATGAKDRGIDARSDMTGFNWSDVPVILPEIGFMSNPAEDRLLATDEYRGKIVAGLTKAVLRFLGM